MRMEQLLYLLVISQSPSMSAASQKLHLTPQALSISIKHLEEELGIKLLKRTNRGTTLTEKGWALVRLTRTYLDGIDHLVAGSHQQEEGILSYRGQLPLYSNHGGANLFLPKLISHFCQYAPQIDSQIIAMPYTELVENVEAANIPYAFFDQYYKQSRPIIPLKNAVFYPLFHYQLVCQVPDKFPIHKYSTLTLESILHYPLIESTPFNNRTLSLLEFLNGYDKPPKIFHVDRPSMVQEFLSAGIGLFLSMALPFHDIDRFHLKNVRAIPVVDDLEEYFGFISLTPALNQPHQQLIDYIRENLHILLTGQSL